MVRICKPSPPLQILTMIRLIIMLLMKEYISAALRIPIESSKAVKAREEEL